QAAPRGLGWVIRPQSPSMAKVAPKAIDTFRPRQPIHQAAATTATETTSATWRRSGPNGRPPRPRPLLEGVAQRQHLGVVPLAGHEADADRHAAVEAHRHGQVRI